MARVRVTNIGKRPRGFYSAGGKFVSIPVGATTEPVTINDGTERALFNSGDVKFEYLDGGSDDAYATLLAKADTMPAADFKAAASALTGEEYATKKAAIEAIHGRNGIVV